MVLVLVLVLVYIVLVYDMWYVIYVVCGTRVNRKLNVSGQGRDTVLYSIRY